MVSTSSSTNCLKIHNLCRPIPNHPQTSKLLLNWPTIFGRFCALLSRDYASKLALESWWLQMQSSRGMVKHHRKRKCRSKISDFRPFWILGCRMQGPAPQLNSGFTKFVLFLSRMTSFSFANGFRVQYSTCTPFLCEFLFFNFLQNNACLLLHFEPYFL